MKKKRRIALWVAVLLALAVLLQFVPVSRDNPPVAGDFDEHQDVERIFRSSCYDCHSYETSWPWYSNVAPISWLIAHDVNEAREHLNFSVWTSMRADSRVLARKEIWEEIEQGDMPLGRYVLLHPRAKLSEGNKAVIEAWAAGLPSDADSTDANSPL